ncbi:MAG TPA: type VI secretion system baseplate subunit TssK [Burkholderiaceae bacterium]|nr:type VI secretion system baseplate subunit TssK [Burkholderiaceae bacterium]
MSWRSRVVWSQGMFLQPHHFQQEGRYHERQLDARARAAHPYAWGFTRVAVDQAALALGRVALAEAFGVLPDGTPFAAPEFDALPPPLDVAADMRDEFVMLAVPLARPGAAEIDFSGTDTGLARYRAQELSTRDHTSASDQAASIQVGQLQLRLLRAKDTTAAYAAVACARVQQRRPDGQVVLVTEFIPPQHTLAATPHLAQMAGHVHGLLTQRAQSLAARMGQLGHGVAEVAHFLMLQMFNRWEPVFSQHARLANAHPQRLYDDCVALAGEFATFVGAGRRAATFPTYNHDDPAACFTPVMNELRDLFSRGIEDAAIAIDLIDRKHGVRTAAVGDLELVRTASFVLAVNAQLPPEQLKARFMAQSKLGPVERIRDLVNLQLPGIGLRNLPVAPRQLPYHAGFFYFELERSGDLWKQFERAGNLAIHVAGDFPGLEMELWAIRQQA